MNDTRNKKEKNQHIQVFVRVRPINSQEKFSKSPVVVDVPSNKDVVVRERPQDKLTKKFTFDKVFGPTSKQIDVYNAVVSPLLEEVLAGYNCTVFAYGQTGTGKTFTMEGQSNDPSIHWQSDTSAGIIPRALSHLFDELRTLGAQEYSVRVSFLELYNEELFDLLSPTDDASKIRIYEDASKKGAIIIHGLEEVTVHNKSEVYKILEKGSEKRQTAATLMNAHSSRSHTVFSITVHIKENTVDGEELLKTGKLNLVDLAGSENVGRSGAVDRRAREAGNINQSLLTLGRVITALVERAPHIPYRESKLTRLLQESLGGRTKTSIIATISPANLNIEETLSTLDYAHRAKNITNRPEINQKLSKKALLKEYTEEIERLRRDLLATRERNGVYLAQENYNEMQTTIEYQSKEIEEKINHIKALEDSMKDKEKLFTELQMEYETQTNRLHETKDKLESTKNRLITTKHQLNATEFDRDIHKHLVEKHVTTEQQLLNQAQKLLSVADTATTDTEKLHDKIIRKKKVEDENQSAGIRFRQDMSQHFQSLEQNVAIRTQDLLNFCAAFKNKVNGIVVEQDKGIDETVNHISKELVKQENLISDKLVQHTNKSHEDYHSWIQKEMEKAYNMTKQECHALNEIAKVISPRIRSLVETKIAENLKALNKETDAKIADLVNTFKTSMDTFCNKLHENRSHLTDQINELKKNVEITFEKQSEISKEEDDFSTMFTELTRQYENTWKCYNDMKERKKHKQSTISSALSSIKTKATDINDRSVNNFNVNISTRNEIEKKLIADVGSLKSEISSNLEYNCNIAENVAVQSLDVINQLEGNLNASQHVLSVYKNSVEKDCRELKQKVDNDRELVLSSVQQYHHIISNASSRHVKFMEEQRTAAHNNSLEMDKQLDYQSTESSKWNEKITSNLQTTQSKIDKFINEDLQKDIPTGTTPARREFSYPRILTATSPHERIIQRFKGVRKVIDTSEDEDNTVEFCTPKNHMNGTDTIMFSPMPNKDNHLTSTPNSDPSVRMKQIFNNNTNYSLIKSASTSDLQVVHVNNNHDSTAMSESEILKSQDNKENGEEDFVKPGKFKTKRLSKVKTSSRKVLGSYN